MVEALHLARRRLQRIQAICDLFGGFLLVGAAFLVIVFADVSILRQLTKVTDVLFVGETWNQLTLGIV
jgi:hypothetical protein